MWNSIVETMNPYEAVASSEYTMTCDYPGALRCVTLKSGDEVYIKSRTAPPLGSKWRDRNAIVIKIDYAPKKWWQFWKKKTVLGYVIRWL